MKLQAILGDAGDNWFQDFGLDIVGIAQEAPVSVSLVFFPLVIGASTFTHACILWYLLAVDD